MIGVIGVIGEVEGRGEEGEDRGDSRSGERIMIGEEGMRGVRGVTIETIGMTEIGRTGGLLIETEGNPMTDKTEKMKGMTEGETIMGTTATATIIAVETITAMATETV